MPLKLSPLTQQLIEKLFEPVDQDAAAQLLIQECGNNLPFCSDKDEYQMERTRFAVLRLSIGYLDDLTNAVNIAKRDWRDALVWARFGDDLTAHAVWAQQMLNGIANPLVVILMGTTGSGKTTIGSLLAKKMGWMYYEADNFLARENFNKVVRGEPLTEEEIQTWMEKIRSRVARYVAKQQPVVFACTALKQSFRQSLQISDNVYFVYLRGTHQQLEERQKNRKSRLPHLDRLAYEYQIFEAPGNGLAFDITEPPLAIVEAIAKQLNLNLLP